MKQIIPRVVWANPQKSLAVLLLLTSIVLVAVKVHMDFQVDDARISRWFEGRAAGKKVQVVLMDQDKDHHYLFPEQQLTLDAQDFTTDEDSATFEGLQVTETETGSESEEEQPSKSEQNNQNSVGKKTEADNKEQGPGKGNDLNKIAKETTAKLAKPYLQAGPSHFYTNLLDVKPPKYLANYRNPCWLETIDNAKPYDKCVFRNMDNFKSTFDELETMWKSKLKTGQNWRLRCLPYFYIVGMPKCGTSELYTRLRMHPEITHGPMKETHYWTRWRVGWLPSGYVPIRNYADMYDLAATEIQEKVVRKNGQDYHPMIFGDGSVTTLYENDWFWKLPENSADKEKPTWLTPHYIKHIQSEARIIAILRDPVERLYSDYLFFESSQKKSPQNFHQFAIKSTSQLRECIDLHSLEQCIYNATLKRNMELHVRAGIYAPYVKSYLETFPREHVMIIRLEDYSKDRIQALNDALAFLGIGNMPKSELEKIENAPSRNHRNDKMAELGDMLEDTRKLLKDFYKPFNKDLAQLLDDKRFLWDDL